MTISKPKFIYLAGFLLVTLVFLFTLWTDKNLDFWVSFFRGEPVDVSIIWAFLLNFTGPLIFIFNIISEIAKYLL